MNYEPITNNQAMIFERKTLKNGLRLLTIPMPGFESATVLVMVGAGSRYEKRNNSGISHFLEHMAFKGTKKRPSALDIANLIDGMGGEFNAYTGKETTGYYIKSAAANIELSIDVLSDMLQNSLLDPKEIEKEKGVIIEELNLYEDTPVRKIGDIYEELLYGDTPLGWDIGGSKDVIRKITHQDFVEYMKSLYSADNITVVVAGGVETKKMTKLIEKYFGQMPSFKTLKAEGVKEKQSKPAVKIRHKKTEQVHIALGVRTVPLAHPDRYALDVLASMLGGGMSSRLFTEVREKRGLAYYVRTHADQYVDCGSLVTMAGVDAKRVEEAIKVIIDEYLIVASEKGNIMPDELKKAKEYLKGHMVLELEDSRSVANFYAAQELLENKIDNPIEVLKKIDAVTEEQIKNVAQKYLNLPLNLAIIGDFKESGKFEKLLK